MPGKRSAPKDPRAKAALKKPAGTKPGTGQEAAKARRKAFAEAYLANGGNGTQAAIQIGLSERSAHAQACRLLKHPEVQALVAAGQQRLADRYELTTDSVARSLAQALFFDPRKLYDEQGRLKDVHELDEDTAMALAGFEVTEEKQTIDGKREVVGFTKKVKWLDKNAARDQAMKYRGMYQKDNAQRGLLDGVPREVLKAIVERLRAPA